MVEKKCLMCGCTEFVSYSIADGMVGEYSNYVDSYACVNCGLVMSFAQEQRMQMIIRRKEEALERKAKKEELQKELQQLKTRLSELKAIVNDENQTVKAVREAKEAIHVTENEIRHTESRIGSLSDWRSSY